MPLALADGALDAADSAGNGDQASRRWFQLGSILDVIVYDGD